MKQLCCIFLFIFNISSSYSQIIERLEPKTHFVLNETGILFPSGNLLHNFSLFIPTSAKNLDSVFKAGDTVRVFILHGKNVFFPNMFDTVGYGNNLKLKSTTTVFMYPDADSIPYYIVDVKIELPLFELENNRNFSTSNVEDIFYLNRKRKFVVNYLKSPTYLECIELKLN